MIYILPEKKRLWENEEMIYRSLTRDLCFESVLIWFLSSFLFCSSSRWKTRAFIISRWGSVSWHFVLSSFSRLFAYFLDFCWVPSFFKIFSKGYLFGDYQLPSLFFCSLGFVYEISKSRQRKRKTIREIPRDGLKKSWFQSEERWWIPNDERIIRTPSRYLRDFLSSIETFPLSFHHKEIQSARL